MRIGQNYTFCTYKFKNNKNQRLNYRKQNTDTISFSALKKSVFMGFDLACVNMFKIPIEKFKSTDDFNEWVLNQYQNLVNKTYPARNTKTSEAREKYLNNWKKVLQQPKYNKNPALKLIIMHSITKNLDINSENIPYICNESILDNAIKDIENMLKSNQKTTFDFLKVYGSHLRNHYNIPENGWIKIPSAAKDPINSFDNMQKLQSLSTSTWCTKSDKTEEYISLSDFYIYVSNYKPQVCIKSTMGAIDEIQGPKNDNTIPDAYIDEIERFILENELEDRESRIIKAKNIKEQKQKILNDISLAISSNDSEKILEYFGINTTIRSDGKKILSEYHQPSREITFADLGIDENMLFRDVAEISGKAVFQKSSLQSLFDLEKIGGFAYINGPKLRDIGKLRETGNGACFSGSKITSLKNLRYINGNADFSNSEITDLGELETIKGDAFFKNSKLKNLGKIKEIFGDLRLSWNMTYDPSKIQIHGEIK